MSILKSLTVMTELAEDAEIGLLSDICKTLAAMPRVDGRAECLLSLSNRLTDLEDEYHEALLAVSLVITSMFIDGPRGELVKTVREVVGDGIDVMADAYMGWTLDYAKRMLPLLEPFNLRWLEEVQLRYHSQRSTRTWANTANRGSTSPPVHGYGALICSMTSDATSIRCEGSSMLSRR